MIGANLSRGSGEPTGAFRFVLKQFEADASAYARVPHFKNISRWAICAGFVSMPVQSPDMPILSSVAPLPEIGFESREHAESLRRQRKNH